MSKNKLLIIGCGRLGSQVSILANKEGITTYGLRRSVNNNNMIKWIYADVTRNDFSLPNTEYVLICLSPDESE